MPIKHIEGNLLDFPEDINIIAHCANCQNTFGSGIAAAIKEEYPVAYEADTKAAEEGRNKLGLMSYAVLPNGKRIVNVYAQEFTSNTRRMVDYEAFYSAFEQLEATLREANEKGRKYVLGVPFKIASDRAGGNWTIIRTMLEEIFLDSPVKLIIVKLKQNEPKKS